ncbi:MAG: flagellar biosynthetic protein FliQ [Bryobacteraceae bacterium]|nr:flagellar biosynthetic protein FliQ [Bryobacteraceae bacterium]
MNNQQVVEIVRQTLWTSFWLSFPLLAVGFAAGIVISLIQIVTSMQDASFGAVPRLAAFLAGMVFLLPWMLSRLLAYTVGILGDFTAYAR